MNKVQKGNYYRTRTKKWFEKQGYSVYLMENRQSIYTPRGVIYKARDIAGCDLMAMNGKEIIFIQVKSNKGDISTGMNELKAHPYPEDAKLWVVYWKPRAREPLIRQ